MLENAFTHADKCSFVKYYLFDTKSLVCRRY